MINTIRKITVSVKIKGYLRKKKIKNKVSQCQKWKVFKKLTEN